MCSFINHIQLEIVIDDVVIVPKPVVRDLGLLIDSHLLLKNQVNQVCKCAWSAIRKIGRIRSHLTQDVFERLVHAFITSKLDSCNSILYGLPSCELDKLQRVQNAAARLVTMASKSDHITPILFKLHWLPVKERITFKLLLITFKALHGQAPSYISELLNIYQPSRSLRSSSLKYLSVPKHALLYPTVIERFLSRQLNSGTLYLITLDLLKISTLLKLGLKLSFLRERLICISQMFYSFHFIVMAFHLFQLIFSPCIFQVFK